MFIHMAQKRDESNMSGQNARIQPVRACMPSRYISCLIFLALQWTLNVSQFWGINESSARSCRQQSPGALAVKTKAMAAL